MTREEALAKATNFIEEQLEVNRRDAEVMLTRQGATADELNAFMADYEKQMRECFESATRTLAGWIDRWGDQLH